MHGLPPDADGRHTTCSREQTDSYGDDRMSASIAPSPTGLAPTAMDEAIVRNAEATLETVGRARDAIQAVIFGQDKVVDLSLVTILSGGHGLLVGVPGLAQTQI